MRFATRAIGAALVACALAGAALASDVSQWSGDPANNNATPPNGWPTGTMRPNEVAPTARENMAAQKRLWDRTGATVTSGGTANAQTLTYTQAPTAYTTGDRYTFIAGVENTGATTLNVNGLGAKSIMRGGTTPLTGGELAVGRIATVYYDGTNFQLFSPTPPAPTTTSMGGTKSSAAVTNQYVTGLDTTGALTRAQPNCDNFSDQPYCRKRNYIGNSSGQIDQRYSHSIYGLGYTVAQNVGAQFYIADRWYYNGTPRGSAIKLWRHGLFDTPGDIVGAVAEYALHFEKLGAGGAGVLGTANGIWHEIPAGDLVNLRLGTQNAKRASMGFWVWTSHAVNLPIRLSSQGFNSHRSFGWNCQTQANAWTHCTNLNFQMDTFNAFGTTHCYNGTTPEWCWRPVPGDGTQENLIGMRIYISTSSAEPCSLTPNTWASTACPSANGATDLESISNFKMLLQGFQLVEGATLPPYEMPPYSEELTDAQKFYQQSNPYGFLATDTTLSYKGVIDLTANPNKTFFNVIHLQKRMSCDPTVTIINPDNGSLGSIGSIPGNTPVNGVAVDITPSTFNLTTSPATTPSSTETIHAHWKAECSYSF